MTEGGRLGKRLLLGVAIAIAVALSVAPPALAQASVTTSKTTVDFTGAVLTCPSENVVFNGTGTLVATSTTMPSGERTAEFLFDLNGVTATGLTSGSQYRVVGVTSTGFSFSIGPTQTADTSRFTQTWQLVSLTGGAPLSFQEVLTVIFDANGDLVALVFNGPAECE